MTDEKSVNSSTEYPRCEGAGVALGVTPETGSRGSRIASACPLHWSSLPLNYRGALSERG